MLTIQNTTGKKNMARRYRLVHFAIFFLGILLLSAPSFAGSVSDMYNLHRQQMKNDEMAEWSKVMREGSNDLKAIASGYDCGSNPDFDKNCQNWKIASGTGACGEDGTFNADCQTSSIMTGEKLLQTADHLDNIRRILGDTGKFDNNSVAVEYLRCMGGTKNEGTWLASYDVAACKNLENPDYRPVVVEDLYKQGYLDFFYGPEQKYFVIEDSYNNNRIAMDSYSVGDAIIDGKEHGVFKELVRRRLTFDACSNDSSAKSEGNLRSAVRASLALSYATAIVADRAAGKFDKYAYPYFKSLFEGKKFTYDTIRKDIHLLVAADATIIWHLGQLNAIQGMMTELQASAHIGGIRTFAGQTVSYGVLKTQKEICEAAGE